MLDTGILDKLIIGRVEPHIYAFSTRTVHNYMKVGDTYRPVEQRLNEWRRYFPNLEKQFAGVAKVDDNTYFRDFAIHRFLENDLHKHRLKPSTFPNLPYYSNEFFEGVTHSDIHCALSDISDSFHNNLPKYQFYKFDKSRIPLTYQYRRTETFEPRPNQQDTIDRFKEAVAAGRNNLLMYAVMRFGKSFTAMCCAVEMKARLVVVVSAKADVKQEWKKTVESHFRFEDYVFLDSDSLLGSDTVLSDSLEKSNAVVFLTLQDLCGDEIKRKHRQIFESKFDLLVIDETHYGARAAEYGKVLNMAGKQLDKELKYVDSSDNYNNNDTLKHLDARVRIHLSGTPYRILMGDEFSKKDIIAFYQFTDIVRDQEKWNDEHILEDGVREWDNPYFGFPQMVRFALNPNKSSVEKMEAMKRKGITYAFSELLKPESVVKDSSPEARHRKFVHEQEILDLFKAIDGSKDDENLFAFLDYAPIKKGQMCRHMVCVLPYRASCDALAVLLAQKRAEFKNLGEYQIINIAGFDEERRYKDTQSIRNKIKKCEAEGMKTITLTVNRMLTGSTVEEWDTMLFLKDCASPQEYDQAIFRLQNQYVRRLTDKNGEEIRLNMKPQTLLVDFDPGRMFRLQEQKSQIYNVNVEQNGNSRLEQRIADELRISPIIVLNKDKFREVVPADILDAVREYSANKSVADEVSDIPADLSLLADSTILEEISSLSPIDSSKGINLKSVEGDGDDIDIPDDDSKETDADGGQQPRQNPVDKMTTDERGLLEKKLATCYAVILFFAFLTDNRVKSLEEIIAAIDSDDNNRRIARNIGIKKGLLKLILQKGNPFIISKLDYKIQNINTLAHDAVLQGEERINVALKKFERLSDSEIVTPMNLANEMVGILPDDVDCHSKFLDIASKQGEFARALLLRYGNGVKDNIYSIPTSKLTYEFTRKVYKMLGMPVTNIFYEFNSYDLIEKNTKEIIKQLTDMNFDVIIGNPPYQDKGGSGGTNDASIYQDFCQIAFDVNPNYISMVIPSRWFTGGRENLVKDFRNEMLTSKHVMKLVSFTNAKDLFLNAEIKGGCCYFLYTTSYCGKCKYELNRDDVKIATDRDLGQFDILIREPILANIVERILSQVTTFIDGLISSDTPFGIPTNPIDSSKYNIEISEQKDNVHDIAFYWIKRKEGRGIGYVSRKNIKKNIPDISKPKVFIPEAYGAGESFPHQIIGIPEIASAESVCSQSYLYVAFRTNTEAENFAKYLRTKFLRVLVSASKVSQHAMNKVYRFVPIQDFTENSDIDWSRSIDEIDSQLYAKYHLTEEETAFIEKMIKPM